MTATSSCKRVMLALGASILLQLATWCSAAKDELPPYKRGQDQYTWVLSRQEREDGITYRGNLARLRRVLNDLSSGKPIKVSVLGGSITAGWSAHDHYNSLTFHSYLVDYLKDQYGDQLVTGYNGAVNAVRSNYMSVCYKTRIPMDSDVVLLEMAVNDEKSHSLPEELRRAQEKLTRGLLNFPKRPAVILANSLVWKQDMGAENWYHTAESAWQELAYYYHLPSVSLRGCCFHKLLANDTAGFSTAHLCSQNYTSFCPEDRHKRIHEAFFGDAYHLSSHTGHRVLGELLMLIFDSAKGDLDRHPLDTADQAIISAPLPVPLHKDNYESAHDRCLIGDSFKSAVVWEATNGFAWLNDGTKGRVKFGMIAEEPGSIVRLRFNTISAGLGPRDNVTVYVAYLRSYEHMGEASVECVSGCKCQRDLLQGHITERNSQAQLHSMLVSQHKECQIQITVLESTKSKEHKFKVIGLMASEAPYNSVDNHGFWGTAHAENIRRTHRRDLLAS